MPALIDSAPDCVVSEEVDGTDEASVTARARTPLDFVVGNNYFSEETPCSGFMTFGPGSTYGEEGVGRRERLHHPHCRSGWPPW